MALSRNWTTVVLAATCFALAGSPDIRAQANAARAHVAIAQALPQLEGSHLKLSVVEVTYGPGGSSPSHSHPCPVVGYVVGGSLRMQVNNEPEHVYKAGETFYEAPNGTHKVSANASDREPVKFLATFVCDRETPLTVPPPK